MNSVRLPLQAVILDWAGTTIDYGSRAPAQVFVEIFRRRGIEITEAEARGPMGQSKRDHIAAIIALPRIADMWHLRHGRKPGTAEIDVLYDDFLPLQKEILASGTTVLPGIPRAITELRAMGLNIGSTTGYTRELMSIVSPLAAQGGYAPDVTVCADDVTAGRPAPWMNFHAAELLGAYPMNSVLVVDDTSAGIEAGLYAGAVTVAVTQTGNALGLSESDVAALPEAELATRLNAIEDDFLRLGAHFVINSVADLPRLVHQISDGS
jgi:phosphonoacetaldehyde hydrolase